MWRHGARRLLDEMIRVLLVEDDDIDASVFSRCLKKRNGFEVKRISTIQEIAQNIEGCDAVVCDLRDGVTTIEDAMKAIGRVRKMIPVVVFSGTENPQDAERMGYFGIPFYHKSTDSSSVSQMVHWAIGRHKGRKDLFQDLENMKAVLAGT